MAYQIIFSDFDMADCFLRAGAWLQEPGQSVINVLAVAAEVELQDANVDVPEIHHLTLFYNDGNEPPDPVVLAAYREEHDRQL